MTKQGSFKIHITESGYKLKVALQLKCKNTIVERQVALYLRSVVVVGDKKSTMSIVVERQKLHCDGNAKA